MIDNLPALLVVIPLTISVLMLFISFASQFLMRWIAILTTIILTFLSFLTLLMTLEFGTISYSFGGWAPPWGITFSIDPVSAFVVLLINFLFCLAVLYGGAYLWGMHWVRAGCYYTLFFLMVAGMTGMTISADLFNVFVFMEMSSLSAYVLIAFAGTRANFSAFRYLIIGTIGAKFYLLAVGYLYAMTGSLYFHDVAERIQPYQGSMAFMIVVVLMTVGLGLKMALFPLHGWLPDAHTYAPSTISAMISGVMIKVPAFLLFKLYFVVLGVDQNVRSIMTVVAILAAIGMLAGSFMALLQREMKRMLAYSSVAQIGYVVLGFSLGNVYGIIGGLLHIFNHAIMKSCLFFVAGAVKWQKGTDRIENFKGLAKTMPFSMVAFVISALSMIGLPPTAGFFSKWYLIKGSIASGLWIFVIIIVVSSLLNAIYFFRIIEYIYLKDEVKEEKRTDQDYLEERRKQQLAIFQDKRFGGFELPVTMLGPIVILAVGVMLLGIFNVSIVTHIIEPGIGGVWYGR